MMRAFPAMNRAFLQIYNEELRHIREVAGDFAAAYPKIASRLSIDRESRDTCPDPFVERLLEGFAFLTSRAQLKLEAEFPRFTQGLLETVYPDYLAPSPSAAIVRMEPKWEDKSLLDGLKVARGSQMSSLKLKDEATVYIHGDITMAMAGERGVISAASSLVTAGQVQRSAHEWSRVGAAP